VDGNIGSFDVMAAQGAVGESAGDPLLVAMAPLIARAATMTDAGAVGVVGNGTPGFRPQGDEPSIGPYVGGDGIADPVGPVYENPGCGTCDALSAWVGGAIEGARVLWTTVSEKPSILDIFIMMSENGDDVTKGPISVDDALGKASEFLKDGVPVRSIDGKTGVQFIQEFTENGQKITKRVGFDLNPNSSHVKQLGPHLNLQTQINGKIQKGALADPHIPIDPKTIRPGDY